MIKGNSLSVQTEFSDSREWAMDRFSNGILRDAKAVMNVAVVHDGEILQSSHSLLLQEDTALN